MVQIRLILFCLVFFVVLSSIFVSNLSGATLAKDRDDSYKDFSLLDINGETVRLSSMAGENVLLFFGTT